LKKIRTFAWMGVGLVVLASAVALYTSISGTDSMTAYYMAWILAIFGTITLVLAGFVSRPRLFWLAAVAIGIFYIASLFGWLADNTAGFMGVVMVTLPGVVCIIIGVLIKRTSVGKKYKK
jgi:hypothetical protein